MNDSYLFYKELTNLPGNNISILEGSVCSVAKTNYTIINGHENINFDFSIYGEDKKYKGSFENLNIALYTEEGDPLFYLKNDIPYNLKTIYGSPKENQSRKVSVLTPSGYGAYRVEFLNLVRNTVEFFEMVSDPQLKICNVFYGSKEDKEVPVVGKFIRRKDKCEVQIASGVDTVYMIGLASFFFCRDIYNNNGYRNSQGYDNFARLEMPMEPMMSKTERDSYNNNNSYSINNYNKNKYSNFESKTSRYTNQKDRNKKAFLMAVVDTILCFGCIKYCCKNYRNENSAICEYGFCMDCCCSTLTCCCCCDQTCCCCDHAF